MREEAENQKILIIKPRLHPPTDLARRLSLLYLRRPRGQKGEAMGLAMGTLDLTGKCT